MGLNKVYVREEIGEDGSMVFGWSSLASSSLLWEGQ